MISGKKQIPYSYNHISSHTAIHPLVYNAFLGSTATFSCKVTNETLLLWLVDGIPSDDIRILNRGIRVTITSNPNISVTKSELIIPATWENNHASIECVAIVLFGIDVFSKTALLQVQGEHDYQHQYHQSYASSTLQIESGSGMVCAHEINFHEINSHVINSKTYKINFP